MEETQNITERRRLTRNRMYRYIYDAESPVSKQSIATVLGYSLPTVHQNIAELLEAGLIMPGEMLKSTGGRPAIGYIANSALKTAIGISLTDNHISLLASDLKRNELGYKRIRRVSKNPDFGEEVKAALLDFMQENQLDEKKLLGVGITVPGIIDHETDRIVLSPTLNSKNFSLKPVIEAIPYPVFIENDSTSGGLAEWLSLPMKERRRNFIYLFLENGIGGAIFIDGKPYGGINNRSAEFGHMTIVPDGRSCSCGKKGCLEAYCGGFRFSRDIGVSAEEFFEGLRGGNQEYEALWEDVLCHLAIAINNLRMAYDCDIILGGFVCSYLEPYMEHLKELVTKRNTFEEPADYVKLGKYPNRAGMMGVAWHFTDQFISKI